MQQQLAARFSSPIIWMVLPSAFFAGLHYQPEIMGDNTWLVMGAVFVFALLAADLTAVTGNIGAAWAMHFVNNALAILLVATEGPLSGLALLRRADSRRPRKKSGRSSTSTSPQRSRSGR